MHGRTVLQILQQHGLPAASPYMPVAIRDASIAFRMLLESGWPEACPELSFLVNPGLLAGPSTAMEAPVPPSEASLLSASAMDTEACPEAVGEMTIAAGI